MRALAGPVMLLVVVGGFTLHRVFNKPDVPSRAFLDLEFTGADREYTGSCYSLSTVVVAHTALRRDRVTQWKPAGEDSWTLSVESIEGGYGGPVHIFQHYTFEQHGDQARLVKVEASKGLSTGLADNIKLLLEGPHDLNSTPVDRCLQPGAKGYRFKPRPKPPQ